MLESRAEVTETSVANDMDAAINRRGCITSMLHGRKLWCDFEQLTKILVAVICMLLVTKIRHILRGTFIQFWSPCNEEESRRCHSLRWCQDCLISECMSREEDGKLIVRDNGITTVLHSLCSLSYQQKLPIHFLSIPQRVYALMQHRTAINYLNPVGMHTTWPLYSFY